MERKPREMHVAIVAEAVGHAECSGSGYLEKMGFSLL